MENENLYTKYCIRTYTGKYVNVFEPSEEMIFIEDIAHALSQQCRFSGHTQSFFSVAEHSTYVYDLTSEENKLQALLHDASEAYLVDIPTPIKKHLENYKLLENNMMHVIASKFGFSWPMSEEVKRNDKLVLEFEWNNCVLNSCEALTSKESEELFLTLFKSIIK